MSEGNIVELRPMRFRVLQEISGTVRSSDHWHFVQGWRAVNCAVNIWYPRPGIDEDETIGLIPLYTAIPSEWDAAMARNIAEAYRP